MNYGTIRWEDHFSCGGTGITKFSANDLPLYVEALKRHGDDDLFLVGHELHIKNGIRELGPFWKIFEAVKEEFKQQSP